MSSSPLARKTTTQSQDIPIRRILVTDENQIPHDYSATPGGTLYSTTPGGTRIIYERSIIMNLRQSPLSRTPPKQLPNIPGVTSPAKQRTVPSKLQQPSPDKKDRKDSTEDPQFEMDI